MKFRKRREPEPEAPWWDPSVPWTPSGPPRGRVRFDSSTGVHDEAEEERSRRQAIIAEEARSARAESERQEREADAAERRPGGDDGPFANL